MITQKTISEGYYDNEHHYSVDVIACDKCHDDEDGIYDEVMTDIHLCKKCLNDSPVFSMLFKPNFHYKFERQFS